MFYVPKEPLSKVMEPLCLIHLLEYEKRYGLVYVDIDEESKGTFKRIKKKSYHWYKAYLKGKKYQESLKKE